MRSAMFTMGALAAVARRRGWANVRESDAYLAVRDISIMTAVAVVLAAVLVAVVSDPPLEIPTRDDHTSSPGPVRASGSYTSLHIEKGGRTS